LKLEKINLIYLDRSKSVIGTRDEIEANWEETKEQIMFHGLIVRVHTFDQNSLNYALKVSASYCVLIITQ
jgi:hypothetical protein